MNDCTLLGYAEIAELLAVKVETVRQWKWTGTLPAADGPAVNGRLTWTPDTILEWATVTGRLPLS